MAHDHSALLTQLDALKSADPGSVFAELIRAGLQALIEAEATAVLGAGRYERTEERTNYRNGTRPKTVATTSGDVEVQIPKLRSGSFFPSLLERRRRIDQALHAVIMEAYVHGVSTRNVDDLVAALGVESGVSKSQVSRICAGLDVEIARFRERTLTPATFPYVFLDATYCKVRIGAHVVSHALVVATGVSIEGTREVLGTAVGDSESFDFWREFLTGLKARGLSGVHLVISDAHAGLKAAVAQQFTGASWQRCRVHFMRNVGSAVSSTQVPPVMAEIGKPILPDKVGWLHSEMLKTRVAHGYCSRHESAGACPYANICETCDNYVTAPEFRDTLTNQRDDIQALRTDAEARGWINEAARHERVANALTDHLHRLDR
jgi:putative transposase